MNSPSKIYSASYNISMASKATAVETFTLDAIGRQFSVESILWNLKIEEHLTGVQLPLNNQTTQFYSLQIGTAGGQKISNSFVGITPANWVNRGDGFLIYEPNRQINFTNWFVNEQLQLATVMTNNDLLKTYDYAWSLIIEIDIID